MGNAVAQSTHLLFRASGRTCALPLRNVVEMMRPLPADAIPGMPPFIRGISIIRGRPLPIIDLARLLGIQGMNAAGERIIVLEAEGRRAGMAVDEVLGIEELDGSTLADLPHLSGRGADGVIEAIVSLDAKVLVLLSAARLLEESVAALHGGKVP